VLNPGKDKFVHRTDPRSLIFLNELFVKLQTLFLSKCAQCVVEVVKKV